MKNLTATDENTSEHKRNGIRHLKYTVFLMVLGLSAAEVVVATDDLARHDGPCFAADLNADFNIDGKDLALLFADWGCTANCASDVNSDRRVDAEDLALLLASWGSAGCPPVPHWATLIEQDPNPEVVKDPALRAAVISTGFAWRVLHTNSGIEMMLIPPGSFQRGSPYDLSGLTDLSVTITRPFYLGRYEVTQDEWMRVMSDNPSYYRNPTQDVPQDLVSTRPVDNVSWNSAQEFLLLNQLRLPTEAEWEHAYRAGLPTAFHASSEFPRGVNSPTAKQLASIAANIYSYSGVTGTIPVGQLLPNGLGLHDMSGNVGEWVADRGAGVPTYANWPAINPTNLGSPLSSTRVVRGGAVNSACFCELMCFERPALSPASTHYPDYGPENPIGFRVARTP